MIGIDLGTSNTGLAVWNNEQEAARALNILQLFESEKLVEKPLLPSMLYVGRDDEEASGVFALPWSESQSSRFAVGEIARQRSSETPDRVVVSAKSWLCNQNIDRREAVLPWNANLDHKLSPVEVSRHFLEHARNVIEQSGTPDGDNGIVLTVPASFDDVARSLTVEAAQQAGFEQITLLEEPLAALYSWLATHSATWREILEPGDCVLVCDVGGGTADFSVVLVTEEAGELCLERISVGDHILLGGDNMDLALAFTLQQELIASGKTIDEWQFRSLVHSARGAKELLFSGTETDEIPISIASSGSSLFGNTISTALKREHLQRVLLDGFFPKCSADAFPEERNAGGFQEFGLPYASDPALTRHLAAFLSRSRRNILSDEALQKRCTGALSDNRSILSPTAILFNGGVFNAPILKERVFESVQSWSARPLRELTGAEFDLAVSRGAAYYGYLKSAGEALRIRSGTSRSYYLGVEPSMPAIPGFQPPVQGLCVVPQGMEEGSEVSLAQKEFGLRPGSTAHFRFFCSATRAGDVPGVEVQNAEQELLELDRLEVSIPESEDLTGIVPVTLHSRMTEVGTLELWMKHSRSDKQWKIEFEVRAKEQ